MSGKTQMTSRIAVHPDTLAVLKDLAKGIDAKNHDELVNFLLSQIVGNEKPMLVGLNMREEFEAWRKAAERDNKSIE